jgi:acyl-CoA thioester hydrolase
VKPPPSGRGAYAAFSRIETRWMDNDAYGHVNNVQYYSFFDTAVNRWLVEQGVLDIAASPVIGLVVETRCSYFKPLSFPERVEVGLAAVRTGRTSVTYAIGVFREGDPEPAAAGEFTHVYVDRATGKAVALPAPVRAALTTIARG